MKEDKNKKFYNKEDAYKLLQRVDSWINNCDTKFSILLAVLGIFFGLTLNLFTCFTNLSKILPVWKDTAINIKILTIFTCVLVSIYLVLIILSITFVILGINAKTKNKNKNLLFWGCISSYKDYKSFEKKLTNINENKYISFLNEQIFINSKICTKKFYFYKKSLFFIIPAFILAIISLILLYI